MISPFYNDKFEMKLETLYSYIDIQKLATKLRLYSIIIMP